MIQALCIGAPLAQYLPRHGNSRVVAHFDSTIQLESAGGALWAITVHPNAGAMRMVAPIVPSWRDGASVHVRDRKISADDFELTWESSALFDPNPRRRALNTNERRRAAQGVASALAQWRLPDALGFWDELSELWALVSLPYHRRGRAGVGVEVEEFVYRLIGRGPGLTPTGDDFLQALLATLYSGDALDRAGFDALAAVVASNLSRTTRTSQAFLCEALHGWTFGVLKNVLDAFPVVTQETVRPLLEIGATSGPAYAFGVLMGLSYCHCEEPQSGDEAISEAHIGIASSVERIVVHG